jgi:hypothetical protein
MGELGPSLAFWTKDEVEASYVSSTEMAIRRCGCERFIVINGGVAPMIAWIFGNA